MADEHVPTDKQRQYVELCAASGIQQSAIAGLIGVSVPTLTKHYRAELDFGKQKMLAQVAATLFQKAVGRKAEFDEKGKQVRAEIKPDTTAAIFIMKAQGGWKETSVVEHVDPTAGARDRLADAVGRVLASFKPDGSAEAPAPEAPDRQRPN